jgi:hypothetical protein
MTRDRGGGGKLERGVGGRVGNGDFRGGEMIGSPRRFRGCRMVEGREEEEFACKVTEGTKGVKCER